MIYLAIPYTQFPDISFEIANRVTADLMKEGHVVFSPISHSHNIADHLPDNLRFSFDFWMDKDLPILRLCDEVKVVVIGKTGHKYIKNSPGCQREIKEAENIGIPVTYLNITL